MMKQNGTFLNSVDGDQSSTPVLLAYSELTPPDPKSCLQLGETSRESRPNMRLVAVEQLHKIENNVFEVNVASFSLCSHW